ncbi:ribonuclease P protein component, partial [Candidatus Curtissbacteria bacterium]|nr:ribonuclease P protein component [Candidatus Curtissbacteria bacterium]
MSDFKSRQRQGDTRVANADFVLNFKKQPHFKAAVIVGRRVARRAVDRNRIKRLVFEALRDIATINGELKVSVQKNIAHFKKQEVQKSLGEMIA